MSERKPIPIHVIPARSLCPICGKPSYSRTGTHPQCAVARADAIARAAVKAAGPPSKKSPDRKPWSKLCPSCKRQIPARRFVCDCGHQFAATPEPGSSNATAGRPEISSRKPR